MVRKLIISRQEVLNYCNGIKSKYFCEVKSKLTNKSFGSTFIWQSKLTFDLDWVATPLVTFA